MVRACDHLAEVKACFQRDEDLRSYLEGQWPEQFQEIPVGTRQDALRRLRRGGSDGQPLQVNINELAPMLQECVPAETMQNKTNSSQLWSRYHRALLASMSCSLTVFSGAMRYLLPAVREFASTHFGMEGHAAIGFAR